MRRLIYGAAMAATMAFITPTLAGVEPPEPPPTEPVVVDMQLCFYECKGGRTLYPGTGFQTETWRETTTVLVANTTNAQNVGYVMTFLDGNERVLHTAGGHLSHGDIDEIDVCRTIRDSDSGAGPINVPEAGLVSVVFAVDSLAERNFDPDLENQFNTTWVKNFVGQHYRSGLLAGFPGAGEPFFGGVDAIGKTRCQPSIFLKDPAVAHLAPDQILPQPQMVDMTGEDVPYPWTVVDTPR